MSRFCRAKLNHLSWRTRAARVIWLVGTIFTDQALGAAHLVATLANAVPAGVRDRVVVILTLKNDGDEPVHIFEGATPFIVAGGRLARDQFEVLDPFGHRAKYRGAWINWGGMVMSVFRLVKPGEVLQATVDLTTEYDFGGGGAFDIRYELSMDWEPAPDRNSDDEMSSFIRSDQDAVISNTISVLAPAYQLPPRRFLSKPHH